MSAYTIGMVMDRLLTDESLRLRLAVDRVEVLGELPAHGLKLTPSEIDLFIKSDMRMWTWAEGRKGNRTP